MFENKLEKLKEELYAKFNVKEELLKAEWHRKEAEQETKWAHENHVQYEHFCLKTIEEVKAAAIRSEEACKACMTALTAALARPIYVNVIPTSVGEIKTNKA